VEAVVRVIRLSTAGNANMEEYLILDVLRMD
jgi:hypothetical protein